MGINDPTPAVLRNGAAIAPRPTGRTELVGDDFPVFHLRMFGSILKPTSLFAVT